MTHKKIFNQKEFDAINEFLPALDISDAINTPSTDKLYDWIVKLGSDVLDSLESKIGELKLPDLIKSYKERDGAIGVEVGYELSKTFIKSTDSFMKMMEKNINVYNDWIGDLDQSTFTLWNDSNDEIGEQLEFAKHEKLREIMINNTNNFLAKNRNNDMANKLLEKLNSIEIRSIW